MVAVDTFTKWVEIGLLKSKAAIETAGWFEREILARFGTPNVVQTDNGTEYAGEF